VSNGVGFAMTLPSCCGAVALRARDAVRRFLGVSLLSACVSEAILLAGMHDNSVRSREADRLSRTCRMAIQVGRNSVGKQVNLYRQSAAARNKRDPSCNVETTLS
jgi:hypothetical protein